MKQNGIIYVNNMNWDDLANFFNKILSHNTNTIYTNPYATYKNYQVSISSR